jgi:sporadic carbohydrate cluster 2OG-Fe(II) oxygenase
MAQEKYLFYMGYGAIGSALRVIPVASFRLGEARRARSAAVHFGVSAMSLTETFSLAAESSLAEEFLSNGYVIRDVEDRPALDEMRHEIATAGARLIDETPPSNDADFLDNIHKLVPFDKLNAFRLGLYREINSKSWFRPTYFALGRRSVESLVGNELAMQNRINFSIQQPQDRTSLLDIHADVFAGETPYQIVQWLPLVDVHRTKSMFFLPRPKSEAVISRLKDFSAGGMPALYEAVRNELVWLEIPYGKVLLFCPNFLHGNVVNEEQETRWTLNCRFKNLFTPYGSAEKALGSYYLPLGTRAATRMGMAYQVPGGFEE